MSLIPFPNVPDVAGVPQITRGLTVPTVESVVSAASVYALQKLFGEKNWGIYQDGKAVLVPDSFLRMGFRNSSRISRYIVEKGSFSTYNKVETPYEIRIGMSVGLGSGAIASLISSKIGGGLMSGVETRAAFIAQLEKMVADTELFEVVTPEKTYRNANLVDIDFERDSASVSTIEVELIFEEVRQTGIVQSSNVQEPSGADPENNGQVQVYSVSLPTVEAIA